MVIHLCLLFIPILTIEFTHTLTSRSYIYLWRDLLMPSSTFSKEIAVPIEEIWRFISDISKWGTLVPGQIEYQHVNATQSIWNFTGDVGFIKKEIKLRLDIIDWQERSKITFRLTGLNENFSGNGYFIIKSLKQMKTSITVKLTIVAKGMTGPMINTLIKPFLPKALKYVTNSMAKEVTKRPLVAN